MHNAIVDIKGKQIMDMYVAKKRFPEKDKIEKIVSAALTWMNQVFKKKETYLKNIVFGRFLFL